MVTVSQQSIVTISSRLNKAWLVRHEFLVITAILIIVLLFLYRDVIFGGRTFLVGPGLQGVTPYGPYGSPPSPVENRFYSADAGAIVWQMEPWGRMINHIYRSGELPLWNRYNGLGYPFYANPHSAPFDPLLAPAHFAPENLWTLAVDMQLLLRYFLAALFTYLFVRALNVHAVGALLAAVGFICSTYFLIYTTISFARADLLFPMLMYSYHRLAVQPSKRTLLLAVLALWLIIVTGFPENLPLQLGVACLWFLFVLAVQIAKIDKPAIQQFVAALVRLIVAIAAGAMLSGFVLLPFVEFLFLGDHIHSPRLPLPSLDLITILQLLLRLLSPLEKEPLLPNINVVLWLLAPYACIASLYTSQRFMRLYALFFAIGSLAMILVIFRAPVFIVMHQLPLLNMIGLGRALPVFILFFVSCGAGIGLSLWLSNRAKPKAILLLTLVLLSILLLGFLIIDLTPDMIDKYQNGVMAVILVLLAFNVILLTPRIRLLSTRIAGTLVVALIVVSPTEWFEFASRPERYDPFTSAPFVDYLQSLDKPFRILGLDGFLFPNTAGVFGIEDVRYLDALFPTTYVEYLRNLVFEPTAVSRFTGTEEKIEFNRYLDLLNVEYIIGFDATSAIDTYIDRGVDVRLEKIYEQEGVAIYRNLNAFPRAFMVYEVEQVDNVGEAIARLGEDSFNPAQTALIEGALPPNVIGTALNPTTDATNDIVVTAYTQNTMIMHVETNYPGFLVVSEQSFPGWQAFVDGEQRQILTTNGIMRAVYLEAGMHSVAFRFMPISFILGVVISMITLLLLVGGPLITVVRSSRKDTEGNGLESPPKIR